MLMEAREVTELNVGEELERIRRESGMSRKVLAHKVGLSESGVEKIERGDSTPSLPTICAYCRAFPKAKRIFAAIIGLEFETPQEMHAMLMNPDVQRFLALMRAVGGH